MINYSSKTSYSSSKSLALETSNKQVKLGLNQWIKLRFRQLANFEILNAYNSQRS
jgi:hypothetical protein